MTSIYILTWLTSVVSSGLIIGGLYWVKTAERPAVLPQRKPWFPRKTSAYKRHRQGRPDHNPFYTCMMFAMFLGGINMLIGGPIHPSTIDSMAPLAQQVMAVMLVLGTGMCIFGFCSGTRFFRPKADIRDCYRLAVVATPTNVSTLSVYIVAVGNTAHWNLRLFGLGAGGIIAITLAHLLMAWGLHKEIRSLNQRVSAAIKSAVSRTRDDQIDR